MAINCGFSHTNFKTYNLGSGSGYSVREIVTKSVEWYTQNIGIPSSSIVEASRRPGDPDMLLADCTKVKNELKWEPRYTLGDMIRDTIGEIVKGKNQK